MTLIFYQPYWDEFVLLNTENGRVYIERYCECCGNKKTEYSEGATWYLSLELQLIGEL